LRRVADALDTTVAQLAIAWVLSRGTDIVPLIGARRPESLVESLGALDVDLDAETHRAIEDAVPTERVAGARYNEAGMAALDSER
jgi:aryl-alcohol dehydrogenase-like predicted oxidoreductase